MLDAGIALDSGNTTTRQWYALTRVGEGDFDEAIRQRQIAFDLDPFRRLI